jgi:hypothetical protein
MSPAAAVENSICETYQGLLEDCQAARDAWNKRRAEISELGLRGKGIDNELRRLQAGFARSHALVGNHLHDCDGCQSTRGTHDVAGDEGYGFVVPRLRVSVFPDAHSTWF